MIPTHDIVKQKWKDVCLEVSSCSIKSREASLLEGISSVNPGWALKRERKSARFSLKVRNYLKEVFESGEKSGQKANANIVVKHMRSARDSNGKKLFSPHEYLQPSQIISYFSRLVVLTKTPNKVPEEEFSEEDLESAIVLINKAETLEELL